MSTWILVAGLGAVSSAWPPRSSWRDHRQGALPGRGLDGSDRGDRWTAPRRDAAQYDQPFNVRVTRPAQGWLANVRRMSRGQLGEEHHPEPGDGGEPARLGRRADPGRQDRPVLASLVGRPAVWLRAGLAGCGRSCFGPSGSSFPTCWWSTRPRSEPMRSEGPAEQHRPSDRLRRVRAGFRRRPGKGARNTDGPLADEFTRVLREIQIGSQPLRRTEALADRTGVETFASSSTPWCRPRSSASRSRTSSGFRPPRCASRDPSGRRSGR